jgi:HK97 family phage major capsid protein/HK97 family phage prohead protease
MAMNRAYSVVEIKSYDEDSRTLTGIATTPKTDRMGDIVEPEGAEYTLPIPLLWQHKSDSPIGHVTSAKVTAKGIEITAQIEREDEPGELKNLLDKAWQSIRKGLVRGLSIGFSPIEYSEIKGTYGLRFTKWEWLELSAVTIPANVGATIATVKSYDEGAPAATGTAPTSNPPGASGLKSVKILKSSPKEGTVNYAERIRELEATRQAKAAERQGIQEKVSAEGRTKDEAERESFDTLGDEIKSLDVEIKDLRDLEKESIASAKPVAAGSIEKASESRSTARIVVAERGVEPGIRMARLVRGVGLSHRQRRPLVEVVRSLYPDDHLIQKAAVAAHNTTTDAALVSDEGGVYADFVEFLRPQTIIGKFGTNGIPSLRQVPFRAPLVTQTGAGAGYWVGEGAGKPVTKFTWTRTTIDPLKVANIAVVTDELLRSSSPSADRMIRDALVEALRARLDTDFIDPAKAADAGVSPASITNGATPIASSEATASTYVDNDAVAIDVQAAMAGFIAANNAPTTGVWIMSATRALALSMMRNALGQRENDGLSMAGGTFAGLPVIVSEYLDPTIIVLVNASDIYLADEGGFSVDASTEASLQMDNEPTQHSVTPTATALVSMFQTNSVAIRAERTINWALRRASAVQVIEDAYWGATTPAEES